ncbi:MAG: M4 family metallopeptidase, partial [Psychrosphaera sp.]|nr:M4 family metallopeptidase [Psychrosphaera sp.]
FTAKNSGLIYNGESGGINEAFSDITGEVAEYYVTGTTDWLHGSDLRKGDRATRYMATPEQNNRAIGHAKYYFDGVEKHSSSGIFNRAFYLLATTPGWDPRKAYDLFVAANQHYWIESSTFVQGACGVINAALDVKDTFDGSAEGSLKDSLEGKGRSIFDVDRAFIKVGVVCNNYPVTDSDGDGLPDFWESRYALDPANAQDGTLDSDNDGLTNIEEYQSGTIPNNADSDGDNLSDSDELNTHGTNPLLADTDADKLPDNWEVAHGFNPLVANDVAIDSDNDSYSDWIEFKAGSDPKDINDSPVQIARHFESFEGSDLPAGWHIPADNNLGWQIDNEAALRGKQSLKALGQNRNQASIIEWSGYFVAGELSFDVTQTLEHPEPVALYIDDALYSYVNSTPAQWRSVHINLDKGFHTIGFRTYKSSASQQIRIDNIRYFQTAADTDNDGMYDRWEFGHGLN